MNSQGNRGQLNVAAFGAFLTGSRGNLGDLHNGCAGLEANGFRQCTIEDTDQDNDMTLSDRIL